MICLAWTDLRLSFDVYPISYVRCIRHSVLLLHLFRISQQRTTVGDNGDDSEDFHTLLINTLLFKLAYVSTRDVLSQWEAVSYLFR